MAPLLQPSTLMELSSLSFSKISINYALQGLQSNHHQFKSLQNMIFQTIPPSILQDLLQTVMKMSSQDYKLSATMVACLLQLFIHSKFTELVLSDLAYVGDVALEDLDYIENCLETILPQLNNLIHIDLSTHHTKCTWPTCSTNMLNIIGDNCPKLVILNLNNNNRVTRDNIFFLCPDDVRHGCPLLEKLYIQDTSVEPEDVASIIWHLPSLTLLGYKEIGSAITIMHRWRDRKQIDQSRSRLNLTHFENTESRLTRTDGKSLPMLSYYAPNLINLKVRINDEASRHLVRFKKLRHLEIRCFNERGYHDSIGRNTLNFFQSHGKYLYSLTICCTILYAHQIIVMTEYCHQVDKLILYANSWNQDNNFQQSVNNLKKLTFLSLRIGGNELVQTPEANFLVTFLMAPCKQLEEIYLLLRSSSITHEYFVDLFSLNSFSKVKTFIIDAPRRTMCVPMLELTYNTAFLFIENCLSLKVIGNLISWTIDELQMQKLQTYVRQSNYDVQIIRTQSCRINTKYFY